MKVKRACALFTVFITYPHSTLNYPIDTACYRKVGKSEIQFVTEVGEYTKL